VPRFSATVLSGEKLFRFLEALNLSLSAADEHRRRNRSYMTYRSNRTYHDPGKARSFKTKSAALSKLKAAQSVFLERAEALFRMATRACTHSSRQVCIPIINWRSVDLRSALESFSQSSHSEERGAFRFLLWWLFLHRRLRSGNEAQLSLNRFCSLRRVLASGCHSFLFEWLEKVSQPSLAEPFGSD
jgi:hypothetical protein